jgi:hypothetical protein
LDNCFEKNLLALSMHNPDLCSRLRSIKTVSGRYKFIKSTSGETIPAIVDSGGSGRPLHSTVNPKREAERLVSTFVSENAAGFPVFLGLGAGFAPAFALQTQPRTEVRQDRGSPLQGVSRVTVIEYDINGIWELLSSCEYISLFEDPRFTLVVDADPDLIEKFILEQYSPVLYGGIKTIPLRTRTDCDKEHFTAAVNAVQRAVEKVSADYSVQAHFGTRWFVNIIRNLEQAGKQKGRVPVVHEAAICAAGPSLDAQIPVLAEQREKAGSQKLFVISTDTALPSLLSQGLKPDAVISIDCQHISYYHFMGSVCRDIPLFLDIASPPALAGFSDHPFFFSGGHPLAVYISQCCLPIPLLDTSGGNVTYACLSLAENLGAKRITVYGADFSYPDGKIYTRGAYIFSLFEKKQNRFAPLESQVSSFLYRTPFLPPEDTNGCANGSPSPHCYETAVLRFYRKAFEKKASEIDAEITTAQGRSIPLNLQKKNTVSNNGNANNFTPNGTETDIAGFLKQYRADIAALPVPSATGAGTYLNSLSPEMRRIAVTLLPLAAAIKHRRPELDVSELFEEVKRYSIKQITGNR